MSILDLRGPEFLQFFGFLFLLITAACLVFRWAMAGPFDDHPSHDPDLDPLEVAYLAGGAKAATDAAIASLVHREVLTVRGSAPPRLKIATDLPDDAAPLELTVYASVAAAAEQTIRDVRKAAAPSAARLAKRLEEYEYLLDPMRRAVCQAVPIVTFVVLLALGFAKVGLGWWRNRPVAYLVVLCIAAVIVLSAFSLKLPHRTRRGTRFLKRLKRDNAALQATATTAPSQMAYTDLALAFALYGPAVLSMGPLADLNQALKPRATGGSGCGGSSGSSCGSSCGGGCGGCGGD